MKKLILHLIVFLPFLVRAQSNLTITPSTVNAGQTVEFTITGKNYNFTTANIALVTIAGYSSNAVTIINDSVFKATINFPQKVYTGTYNVIITRINNMPFMIAGAITINGILPPSLISITPAIATNGKTIEFTLTGRHTHFADSVDTTSIFFSFSSTVFASEIVPINDTVIKGKITIPQGEFDGFYSVSTYNNTDNSLTLADGFQITDHPHPTVVSIDPNSSYSGKTIDAIITTRFTHYTTDSSINVFIASIPMNTLTVLSDTSLKVNFTIPSSTSEGLMEVAISSRDAYASQFLFTIYDPNKPRIVSANPSNVQRKERANLAITGKATHFKSGAGSVSIPSLYVIVNSTTAINDTLIIADVWVSTYATLGSYTVSVYDSIDKTLKLENAFSVIDAPPVTFVSITPNPVNAGQTLDVTIKFKNTHFSEGKATSVFFDVKSISGANNFTPNSYTIISDTTLIANITVPKDAYTGDYGFLVTDSIDDYGIGYGFHINGNEPILVTPDSILANTTSDIKIISKHKHFNNPAFKAKVTIDGPGKIIINSQTIINDTLIIVNISASKEVGSYYVEVFDSIDLKDGAYLMVYDSSITGIKNQLLDPSSIIVYPNPVNDLLMVSSTIPFNSSEQSKLSIYDLQGRLIMQEDVVKEKMSLDVHALPQGVYLLQLSTNTKTKVIRFNKN